MSRIGKKPITIPPGVTVTVSDGSLQIAGAKGTLTLALHPAVKATVEDQTVRLTVDNPDDQERRALWGLFRKLVANAVDGVTTGFAKQLEVNGVGYRVVLSGKKLVLEVGFSHPVDFVLPEGIEATVEKNIITIRGIDRQLVGEAAARIRKIRPPEPYKGKGIKYVDEVIRRKAGKAVKGATA
ncbi:50S ribosomal protein L6 [Candidatus Uhrbacteria bacterium]|nr:50S ribosomal protein L6 [Candidatus Uhrbacteria bacterium]